MKSLRSVIYIGVLVIGSYSAAAGMGTDDSKMMKMHGKMAKMHTEAMNCMKAGKTMEACHEKMMKDCKMGEEKCAKMMTMMDDTMTKMMAEGMMDDAMMKK